MFKYWSIKKYGTKLLPTLEKRYGEHPTYTSNQIRATVYQDNFSPEFLPLGYILFLDPKELEEVLLIEFPELNLQDFKNEVLAYLGNNYPGTLEKLQHQAA